MNPLAGSWKLVWLRLKITENLILMNKTELYVLFAGSAMPFTIDPIVLLLELAPCAIS